MKKNYDDYEFIANKIQESQAIIIGAGAGLSASGGLLYSGPRFMKYFSDFHEKYGINDMYSGGFYDFSTPEEQWGWWCRHIFYNRYEPQALEVYALLFRLVQDKNYFVLTTNVDHQFQKAGFEETQLFYTQGDYGLFQCAKPCKQDTFSNEAVIKEMIKQQTGRYIPSDLLPHCPFCGAEVSPYLRKDDTFVQSPGWYKANQKYQDFLEENQHKKTLFLELGVGFNTPGIIKIPFLQMTHNWDDAFFLSINQDNWEIPKELKGKSKLILGNISEKLSPKS